MQNSPNRWLVAIMGTVMQIALGTVYAWSYFQQPIMAANNWSNTQVAWAFCFAIFFLGIAAAWGGVNLPKFGPRKMAIFGGVLYSSSYFIAALALHIKSLPLLYLGYGLVGGVGLGLGYVTPVATSAKWFPDKKGLVTGMVVMGFGLGALLMAKVLAPTFMSIASGNLVSVFVAIGLVLLAATIPAGYLLVDPPKGLVPDGDVAHSPAATAQVRQRVVTAKECVLSRKFSLMWLIFFFNITAGIMFIGFQSPLLQDLLRLEIDPATLSDPAVLGSLASAGATLIAISSIFNGVGRFFWGALSDKIGRAQTFRIILGTQVIVFIALIFAKNPVIFSVLVCYVLLCYGGGFGSMPSFVLDVFGSRMMPVVYGAILTAWGCGGIVGPQVVALLKDHFAAQAAQFTFIVAAILLVAGFGISMRLDNKRFASPTASAHASLKLRRT